MEKQLIVSRQFDAPVASVWRIWTEPELITRWWGPDKFTCPTAKLDFRVGGTSLVSMKAPASFGGQEWFSIWEYKNIVLHEKIEFIQSLGDKAGKKMKPTAVGMPPDFPEAIHTLVTFKMLGADKTEMTVTENADFGQMSEFARLGLEQSMDKMIAALK
jgi:uncharacterized protein YndB with AHSA1/START domain